MAKINMLLKVPLDLSPQALGGPSESLGRVVYTAQTPFGFILSAPEHQAEVRIGGSGFQYDTNGEPASLQQVSSFDFSIYGQHFLSISELGLDLRDPELLIALVNSDNVLSTWKYILRNADVLDGHNARDDLYGYRGNDQLFGKGGPDRLDGGPGSDSMSGGAGDDRYAVDNKADRVVERAGQGEDKVTASVSFRLPSHVERLVLSGRARSGTGNGSANVILGNREANRLEGLAGNDTLLGRLGNDLLIGGRGKDVLTGGPGADRFRFRDTTGINDRLTDFNRRQGDLIQVNQRGFGELRKGRLDNTVFRSNPNGLAKDADDRFVFSTRSANLFYDPDGNGAAPRMRLASLTPGQVLQASDIAVI